MVVLVTGANGFLGGAVVRRLARQGRSVLATGRTERAPGSTTGAPGVPDRDGSAPSFRVARLDDVTEVQQLFEAAPVLQVVHCAARSKPWGARRDFERDNVRATEVLLERALAHGVERFVHVSTPAVYFDGNDRLDVQESMPLPRPRNDYVRTKLAAEHAVRRAAERGLGTVVLRPRALFGPGDTTIFPRLLKALERGRLPIIGHGRNRTDLTYIDNAALAVERALDAPPDVLGRTYNVTNGEPVALWPLITRLASELHLAQPRRRLPKTVALAAASLLELVHRACAPEREPLLTRYTVGLLAVDATLDIGAARRDLGYAPEVTVAEGLQRFLAWWRTEGAT